MGNKCLKLQYKFLAKFLKRSYQDISHTNKTSVVSRAYELLLASSFWYHFRNVSRTLLRFLQETISQMRTILNILLIPNWWIWKMAQFAEHQFLTTRSGKRSLKTLRTFRFLSGDEKMFSQPITFLYWKNNGDGRTERTFADPSKVSRMSNNAISTTAVTKYVNWQLSTVSQERLSIFTSLQQISNFTTNGLKRQN